MKVGCGGGLGGGGGLVFGDVLVVTWLQCTLWGAVGAGRVGEGFVIDGGLSLNLCV